MNPGMKALIVDDEFHIRRGVRTSVPWEDLGVWEVEEAADGSRAIALFDEHAPDIVVLDINMPGQNGMEVARHIRDSGSAAQIIFLTGYDDFPKVKEAITLQASDYLLKPVSYSELLQALQKASLQVSETRRETGYVDDLKMRLNTYKRAAVDQLLLDFLQRRRSYRESAEFFTDTGIMQGGGNTHGFFCIDIDDYEGMVGKASERDRQLYLYAYRKLAQEVMESELHANGGTNAISCGYVLNLSESRLLIWLRFAEGLDESARADAALLRVATRLQEAYRSYLRMSVSIGISGTSSSLERLHELHKEAVKAAEFRAVLGLGRIIPVHLLEPPGISGQKLLAKELFVLGELRAGSGIEFEGILEDWIAELTQVPLPEARMIAAQLVVYGARVYAEQAGDQLPDVQETLSALAGCETIGALADFMRSFITTLFERIRSTKKRPVIKVIEQAKVWIREHIGEEISLQMLAAALHLNPYYVSRLFKQETGETYLEFTTRLRFERARELLSGTPLKMHEIAGQVGFPDANYFSIAFKKHQGVSPTDFRKRFQ
jgi:two-component system response regulator YesN